MYTIWACERENGVYKKIVEFESKREIDSRMDEVLKTGLYSLVVVLVDNVFVKEKKYRKSKVKKKLYE